MCDQTPVEYKEGDVVWVKLGPCWWPGEVYEIQKLPEEVIQSFKKPPIAAVKFFDEEKFEYVKTIDKIYFYNCKKKMEFIKKGLSLARNKKQNVMEKFPIDISIAEEKTKGDPNILQSPIFNQDIRPDYSTIFGSAGKQKQSSSTSRSSLSSSFGVTTPIKSKTVVVGNATPNNIRVLIQTPPNPSPDNDDKEVVYTCYCGYDTTRINVMVMHRKNHVPGQFEKIVSPLKKIRKLSPKKRKAKSTTLHLDISQSTDDESPLIKKPRKKNTQTWKKVKFSKLQVESPAKVDIRNDLLAEWDEDSDDLSSTLCSTTETSVISLDETVASDESKIKKNSDKEQTLVKLDLDVPEISKSCFDFEEEDDDNELLTSTSFGRKIPRVIPPSDWQKTVDQSDDENEPKHTVNTTDADIEAFKTILEITVVPRLPVLPQLPNIESVANKDPVSPLSDASKSLPTYDNQKVRSETTLKDSVSHIEDALMNDDEVKESIPVLKTNREPFEASIIRDLCSSDDDDEFYKNQISPIQKLPELPLIHNDDDNNYEGDINTPERLVRDLCTSPEPNELKSSSVSETETSPKSNEIKPSSSALEIDNALEPSKAQLSFEPEIDTLPEPTELESNVVPEIDTLTESNEIKSSFEPEILTSSEPNEIKSSFEPEILTSSEPNEIKSSFVPEILTSSEPNEITSFVPDDALPKEIESGLVPASEPNEIKSNFEPEILTSSEPNEITSFVPDDALPKEIESNIVPDIVTLPEPIELKSCLVPEIVNPPEPIELKSCSVPEIVTPPESIELKSCSVPEIVTPPEPIELKLCSEPEIDTSTEPINLKSCSVSEIDNSPESIELKSSFVLDIDSSPESIELKSCSVPEIVTSPEPTVSEIDSDKFLEGETSSTVAERLPENNEVLNEEFDCSSDHEEHDAIKRVLEQLETIHDATISESDGETKNIFEQTKKFGVETFKVIESVSDSDSGTKNFLENLENIEEKSLGVEEADNISQESCVIATEPTEIAEMVQGDCPIQETNVEEHMEVDECTDVVNDFETNSVQFDANEEELSLDQKVDLSSEAPEEPEQIKDDAQDGYENAAARSVSQTNFSIQDKPLSAMEENLLALIEEDPEKPASLHDSIAVVDTNSLADNVTNESLEIAKDTTLSPDTIQIEVDQNKQDIEKSKTPENTIPLRQDSHDTIDDCKQMDPKKPILSRQDSRDIIDDSKPINPKKRFVRTFEHLEQIRENKEKRDSENSPDISIPSLKSKVMRKLEAPPAKKVKREDNSCKSFRELILDRQRAEDLKYKSAELDLDLNELPQKILDSPLHEELEDSEDVCETALNLVVSTPDANQSRLIQTALDVKHASILDLEEVVPSNQLDELIGTQPQTAEELRQSPSETELNSSIQDFVQTCISRSCTDNSKNEEPQDLSALSTLAAVSELTTTYHDMHNTKHMEPLADLQTDSENNPTFITEDVLAEGQIEISNIPLPPNEPISLTNFSVDFHNDKVGGATVQKLKKQRKDEPDLIERSLGKVFAEEMNTESDSSNSAQPDMEDQIPTAVVCNSSKKWTDKPEYSSSSKLLEILTDNKAKTEEVVKKPAETTGKSMSDLVEGIKLKRITSKYDPKHTKYVIKSATVKTTAVVEKEMEKPMDKISVQKVTTASSVGVEDVEDIARFIIHKNPPKSGSTKQDPKSRLLSLPVKKPLQYPGRGKAKILQQTILKPGGETRLTITTNKAKTASQVEDNAMFDINSMPIVLSDAILTPENIENMPVVLSESVPSQSSVIKTIGITSSTPTNFSLTEPIKVSSKTPHSMLLKTFAHKLVNDIKSVPTIKSKIQPGRPGTSEKFIIVPSTTATTSNKVPLKRPALLKKPTPVVAPTTPKVVPVTEPTGNKIMIVTNQQGQQSRVLLTPAHQKILGYQGATKIVKGLKSNILQKSPLLKTTIASGISAKPQIIPSKISMERKLVISGKTEIPKLSRKVSLNPQSLLQQETGSKTILFQNQQGQIFKKIQGGEDALLEQQVLEQVKAIKASGSFMKAKQEIPKPKFVQKRSYGKRMALADVQRGTPSAIASSKPALPLLTPISRKSDASSTVSVPPKDDAKDVANVEAATKTTRNQLVIKDASGSRTTITEGQVVAIPSGDGQTQSYMLVTLDESGQLTSLNNEAFLSLDLGSVCLSSDGGNIILPTDNTVEKSTVEKPPAPVQTVQTVCNVNSDSINNQQFIITGDPETTQKFLESLSEGNQDLANLLAGAEGNIIIQTGEQQILINTDNSSELCTTDAGGPLLTSQPSKSQDILAAALADTDVFQQESTSIKLPQLSPSTGMYPTGIANVLETTLSLSSPIMTPLEVPSTNTKKIPDSESDIITTEVPKNVDLPITITDPNIVQTVSQQQLLAASSNLDIPLSISDPGGVALSSAEMNSPSFVYSLPSLDEHEAKSFTEPISMPLLNEDSQPEEDKPKALFYDKGRERGSFLLSDHLLGGDMINSLSEPPSDMFDLSVLNSNYKNIEIKHGPTKNMLRKEALLVDTSFTYKPNGRSKSPVVVNSPDVTDENSSEIPIQPLIVTDLSESYSKDEPTDFSKRRSPDEDIENDRKKTKYD